MRTLEELRSLFRNDIFATQAGIVIEQADERGVICSVKLNDSHRNAIGRVQGGLIFTLADFAFAVLSNLEELVTVTLTSTIQFIAAPQGAVLKAKAIPVREGRSVSYCRIEVSDDTGLLVAEVLATGFRK